MGFHIAWDGPQIYMQIVSVIAVAGLIVWLARRV